MKLTLIEGTSPESDGLPAPEAFQAEDVSLQNLRHHSADRVTLKTPATIKRTSPLVIPF